MRVGKQTNVVEAKKTRSCTVRLEKSPSANSTIVKSLRTVTISSQNAEEKKFKGPIKKRPVASGTPSQLEKEKRVVGRPSTANKSRQDAPSPTSSVEAPPTIAAGRSRRAIKPNPRYTSEDMVTPKSVKNSGATGSQTKMTSGRSSSNSFYRGSSADSEDVEEDEDEAMEAGSDISKFTDSDISEKVLNELPLSSASSKKRGRPPKKPETNDRSRTQQSTTSGTSANVKTTSVRTNTATQLQQLRKNLASGNIRTPMSTVVRKRKPETDQNSESTPVANKIIKLSSSSLSEKSKEGNENNARSSIVGIKSGTGTGIQPNGSKIVKIPMKANSNLSATGAGGAKKEDLQSTLRRKIISSASASPTANLNKSQNNKMLSVSGKSTGLNTSLSPTSNTSNALRVSKESPKSEELKSSNRVTIPSINSNKSGEKATPTFTIVNINDIINKKGDAHILQADAVSGKETTATSTPTKVPNTIASAILANRRKAVHNTILTEKIHKPETTDRIKTLTMRTRTTSSTSTLTTATTGVVKKPLQKILNHSLVNKSLRAATIANASRSASPAKLTPIASKAAPRILNSVVAKRTQPVKPRITNPDDSADDTFSLSLGEDDDDVVEIGKTTFQSKHLNTSQKLQQNDSKSIKSALQISTQRNINTSVSNILRKSTSMSTNVLNNRSLQTKTTLSTQQQRNQKQLRCPKPEEKVVISRQGDKIVKTITCLENWWVISIPPVKVQPIIKNIFEMPLIELANMRKEIRMPSDKWTTKVTLYEVSAAQRANTHLTHYNGDMSEFKITDSERGKYQPSCVMFRRSCANIPRLPYDRAVIFKNDAFFTNMDGHNVRLLAAPTNINTKEDIEILLQVMDYMTIENEFVETAK